MIYDMVLGLILGLMFFVFASVFWYDELWAED